jgi:hypothetical protein
MTSIGKSEYPEMTLSEAIKFIETIKQDKVQTLPGLVKTLGLSTHKSGFANQRIAALAKYYGLIDRDKNSVTLTPLGKRIVYSVSSQDRERAIREAALKVDLFRSLYQSLGSSYHELDFPSKLLELTGATHEEIAAKATRVERFYSDAVRYLIESSGAPAEIGEATELEATKSGVSEGRESEHVAPQTKLSFALAADERHWMYQDGETIVRVEKDRKKVRTVIGMLKVWLSETPPEGDSNKDARGSGRTGKAPP